MNETLLFPPSLIPVLSNDSKGSISELSKKIMFFIKCEKEITQILLQVKSKSGILGEIHRLVENPRVSQKQVFKNASPCLIQAMSMNKKASVQSKATDLPISENSSKGVNRWNQKI